jgi:hypothetical protein
MTGGMPVSPTLRQPQWRAAAAVAARALAIALLVAVAIAIAPSALRASGVAWATVLEGLAPDFRVISLGPLRAGGTAVVQAEVTLARTLHLGGRVQAPHPQGRAWAQVPASQPLQGPVLALAVALAWPLGHGQRRVAELAVRAAVALPLAGLLWLVDTPLALAASLWRLVLGFMAAGSGSPLVAAADLMTDGGRLALGTTVGLVAVGLGRQATQRRLGLDTRVT